MQKRRKYKPRPPRTPSLRRHKASGQAVVTLNGHDHYLGHFGDSETSQKYHALIAEFLANSRSLPPEPTEMTIAELCLLYWNHASSYYVDREGQPTSTMIWVKESIRTLRTLYGSEPVSEFGPLKLRACCQTWIERGLSRNTCNAYLRQTKQLFKWAASRQLIGGEMIHTLATVPSLRRGRSEARETSKVQAVPEADVDAIKPFVNRVVWALIQLQLRTGARGGELLKLRPMDIDTSGSVWIATPQNHKLSYKEKSRELYIGPEAQEIITPFLLRESGACLFSPQEGEAERYAKAKSHRREDQKPNKKKTGRKLGDYYTPGSYRRCIARACEAAGVETWTPHRLRHSAATAIRKEFGIEAAQLILGHANGAITEVYAERDKAKALQIISEIG